MPKRSSRSPSPTARGGSDLVLDTIAEHAPSLLATARRYSICADDAQDAYQRGLEIFLRRADGLDPDGAPAWLRTVIKHEALAVRAARLRLVGPVEADLDLEEAREQPGVDERACAFEELERCAEALARLKPHEIRALVLKAHGHSYKEISQITGWTYTKVNRCLTEGRRSFRERFTAIEEGRECARWEVVLAAAADGEASGHDLVALRPHLRACAPCRATLRDYRLGHSGVAAVVPAAAFGSLHAPIGPAPGLLTRIYEALATGVQERAVVSAQKVQAGLETASASKVAAVAASATALAGGGVAVLQRPLSTAGTREERSALRDRHRAVAHVDDRGRPREDGGEPDSHRLAPPEAERTSSPEEAGDSGQDVGGSEFEPGAPPQGSAQPPPAALAAGGDPQPPPVPVTSSSAATSATGSHEFGP